MLLCRFDYLLSLLLCILDYCSRFLVCLIEHLVECTGCLLGNSLAALQHIGHLFLLGVKTLLEVAYFYELSGGGGFLFLQLGGYFFHLLVVFFLGCLYSAVSLFRQFFSLARFFVVGAHIRFQSVHFLAEIADVCIYFVLVKPERDLLESIACCHL